MMNAAHKVSQDSPVAGIVLPEVGEVVEIYDWPEASRSAFGKTVRLKHKAKVVKYGTSARYGPTVDVFVEFDVGRWTNQRTLPVSHLILEGAEARAEQERKQELRRRANRRAYERRKAGIDLNGKRTLDCGHSSTEYSAKGRRCLACQRTQAKARRQDAQETPAAEAV